MNPMVKKILALLFVAVFAGAGLGGIVINPVEAAVVSVKREAEKAKLEFGAIKGTKYKGYSGTGYVLFPTGKTKARVTYSVSVPKKMTYDVTMRYSNGNKAAKPFAIYKNGVYFKTISLPTTGLFTKWRTKIFTITFVTGTTLLSFRSKDKVSACLDYISSLPATAYGVTLNYETKYQSITGFGGYGGNDASGTFSTDQYVEDTYNDLGATIYRGNIENDFQSTNDSSDPSVINASSFNTQGSFKKWMNYFKALQAKGPCKIFVTIWSPPAWMKSNNDVANGGTLLPAFYQHFAKYCAAYVKFMKDNGVNIYAFNIQNEPNFVEPYISCVYTFAEYAKVNDIVAKRFKKEGLDVKMLGPEDVQSIDRISQYVFNIDQSGTIGNLGVIAVHGYGSDGVNPSDAINFWNSAFALARDFNKPLWMTETSGYLNVWPSVMRLGKDINLALTEGRINAWVWWRLSDNMSGGARNEREGLMKNFVPTPKYYVSKNFYRYIRPGAVRYDCKSTYADLYVSAYKEPVSKKLTIILVNESATDRVISVGAMNGGVTPTQFNSYRTSATENCVDAGLVNASSFVVKASSVTTLQAGY